MFGLTPTGLNVPTLEEIKQEIENEMLAKISPDLDLSASSPLGQMIAIFARQLRIAWEGTQGVYASMNPKTAFGIGLDNLGTILGIARQGATFSTVEAQVTVSAAGTYAAGSLVAHVDTDPTARFTNAQDLVAAAPGTYPVPFVALDPGPIPALSGTLITIAGPVLNWDAVTNLVDAALGECQESDEDYRARITENQVLGGKCTVEAIRACLLNEISSTEIVSIAENVTDVTDFDGLPPHSFEAVVFGPEFPSAADNEEVAQLIFEKKPAGTATHGNTSVTVTDSQGIPHIINFTRPTVTIIDVVGLLVYNPNEYLGDAATIQGLVDCVGALPPGTSMDWSEIVCCLMDQPGVIRVTGTSLNGTPFGFVQAGPGDILTLSTGNVTLFSSPGQP